MNNLWGNTSNVPYHPFPSYEERGAVSVAVGFLVLIAVVAAGLYLWHRNQAPGYVTDDDAVICIADARLCSDGSYVGRGGHIGLR